MTQAEANKIIGRLASGSNVHRFEVPEVVAEYQKALVRFDYIRMNAAVDRALEIDSKYAPAISALIEAYKESKTTTAAEVQNNTHCDVCDDKGYILLRESAKNGDETLYYEYVYYCPYCSVGRAQAYNGNDSKDHKSAYVCRPITDVLDDEAIGRVRYGNAHPHAMTDEEKETLRKKLESIGLRLPAALDRGDAWEGDANGQQCPF